MTASRDYERIAQAIRFLNANRQRQPSLAEVAADCGLTAFHFQRLFRRWAGLSPKQLLQYLNLSAARRLLRESQSVLDASLELGLSGPGRLHDLFVSVLAMSPGEFKSGAAGMELTYGVHDSPFGDCLLVESRRGLCGLEFLDGQGAEELLDARWPAARHRKDAKGTGQKAQLIFGQAETRSELSLHLRGSWFQIQVWEALLRIPAAAVCSYGRLAELLGRPGSARAVAGAVAANPIAWLIPCHRVLRETGAISGYRWDPIRKQAMLARETAQSSSTSRQIQKNCRMQRTATSSMVQARGMS